MGWASEERRAGQPTAGRRKQRLPAGDRRLPLLEVRQSFQLSAHGQGSWSFVP